MVVEVVLELVWEVVWEVVLADVVVVVVVAVAVLEMEEVTLKELVLDEELVLTEILEEELVLVKTESNLQNSSTVLMASIPPNLAHGWDKNSLLSLSTLKHVKCYPTMQRII